MAARRSYGTGSLYTRPDRKDEWYGRWRIGDQKVNRRIGSKRTPGNADGLTRSQAEARLRELMAEVTAEDVRPSAGVARRPDAFSIEEVGRRYLDYAREVKGLKEGTTLKDQEMVVRVHLAPFFGETPVQRIDAARVEAFIRHLQTKKGQGRRGGKLLSPKTIANYLGALSVLLNFAVKKKWIAASPMAAVDLPRAKTDQPLDHLQFLEPHEVATLIEHVAPGAYRELDRALYAMATYTGLRQGELRGLRWEHVDFGRSLVHVMEGFTRGRSSSPKGKRRRTVPLAPTAAQMLLELRAASLWTASTDPVFACTSTGKPMARAGLMERYREALAAAELPVAFSFHDLRHTFGTTMARAGIEAWQIQQWMGHQDRETTDLYMHYAPRETDAARIEAAFGPGTIPGTNLSAQDGPPVRSVHLSAA